MFHIHAQKQRNMHVSWFCDNLEAFTYPYVSSVKVAAACSSEKQILENIAVALPIIVANVSGEWDNVQSLNIKTSQSTSLPIWTSPQLCLNTASLAGPVPVQMERQDNRGIESGEQGIAKRVVAGLNAVGRGDAIELKSKILTHDGSSSSSAKSVAQNRSGLLRKKEKFLAQKGKIENRGSKRIIVGRRRG